MLLALNGNPGLELLLDKPIDVNARDGGREHGAVVRLQALRADWAAAGRVGAA